MSFPSITLTPAAPYIIKGILHEHICNALLDSGVLCDVSGMIAEYADCSLELSRLPYEVIAANGNESLLLPDSRSLLANYRNRIAVIDLRGVEFVMLAHDDESVEEDTQTSHPSELRTALAHSRERFGQLARVFSAAHTLYRPTDVFTVVHIQGQELGYSNRPSHWEYRRLRQINACGFLETLERSFYVTIDEEGNRVVAAYPKAATVELVGAQGAEDVKQQEERPSPEPTAALATAVAGLSIDE